MKLMMSPKVVVEITYKSIPDITINATKMPNIWYRFWSRLFLGAKFKRV